MAAVEQTPVTDSDAKVPSNEEPPSNPSQGSAEIVDAVPSPAAVRHVSGIEIEEKHHPGLTFAPSPSTGLPSGNRNLEIRREITQEDKELSRANYDHLEKSHSHDLANKDSGDDKKESDRAAEAIDISEHKLSLARLAEVFEVEFDSKAPGASKGLSPEEAAARLVRNGPNVLTPPKKKSAFQKV